MKGRLALALGLTLTSCAADNSLGGSLGEIFPLDVSRVEVAQNLEALQVTYFRNRGVFLDVVVRMSISIQAEGVAEDGGVPTLELKPGTKLNLAGLAPVPDGGEYDGGVRTFRAAFTHAPGGEPVRNLPPIERGDLVLVESAGVGEPIRGNFSVLFAREGGDVGFGRTLYGAFSSQATLDAGFGDP